MPMDLDSRARLTAAGKCLKQLVVPFGKLAVVPEVKTACTTMLKGRMQVGHRRLEEKGNEKAKARKVRRGHRGAESTQHAARGYPRPVSTAHRGEPDLRLVERERVRHVAKEAVQEEEARDAKTGRDTRSHLVESLRRAKPIGRIAKNGSEEADAQKERAATITTHHLASTMLQVCVLRAPSADSFITIKEHPVLVTNQAAHQRHRREIRNPQEMDSGKVDRLHRQHSTDNIVQAVMSR